MKFLISLVFIAVFLNGCTDDIKNLSKSECVKQGYKYIVKNDLNFRTGKKELRTQCIK
ncbi:hypothetical protein [Poseidonibacter sp.]|uniref:hypothetical protein n=1 Tax=Poseidonibacter sp. TaxID=2321188 RepID=UPI003C724247